MLFDNYPLISCLSTQNRLTHTQVWQAIDPVSQQNVVIKRLLPDFSPLHYQHFYQEYQVYQALKSLHPPQSDYFFQLINAHLMDKENGLIFDYYQGKTLQQACHAMTINQKIDCLIQLCQAIEILHLQGIIHCDIKPSNIFVTHQQVKLFDFGLAQIHNAFSQKNALPATITAGTPAYMSPEQFTGGILSPQSDYYSLGIVLYEILLVKKPFFATTIKNWAISHCQSPIPQVRGYSPSVNARLQSLFNSLLAKFPHNRPNNLIFIITSLKDLQKLLK